MIHDRRKSAKRLVMLVGATCALCMAMIGISVASAAALQVKSCENATLSTCKKASASTSLTVKGLNVKFSNNFLSNTCTVESGGLVSDAESLSAGDPIAVELSSVNFATCNAAPITAKIPWVMTTDTGQFPSGKFAGVELTEEGGPFLGNCVFAETASNKLTFTWTNGNKSSMTLGGSLVKVSGVSGCGSSLTASGSLTLTGVKDPNNLKANNLRIE